MPVLSLGNIGPTRANGEAGRLFSAGLQFIGAQGKRETQTMYPRCCKAARGLHQGTSTITGALSGKDDAMNKEVFFLEHFPGVVRD